MKRCIVCEKELEFLYPETNITTLVNGGFTEQIVASYGSKFDGMMLEISICDECLQDKLNRKII
jgi:hypothetical protein